MGPVLPPERLQTESGCQALRPPPAQRGSDSLASSGSALTRGLGSSVSAGALVPPHFVPTPALPLSLSLLSPAGSPGAVSSQASLQIPHIQLPPCAVGGGHRHPSSAGPTLSSRTFPQPAPPADSVPVVGSSILPEAPEAGGRLASPCVWSLGRSRPLCLQRRLEFGFSPHRPAPFRPRHRPCPRSLSQVPRHRRFSFQAVLSRARGPVST